MSHFIVDAAAKAKAAALVSYAEAHPYRPETPGARIPADDPGLVAIFDSFRVVFSITEMRGVRLRQLSISLVNRRRGIYPHPHMAFAMADLLGFTGWAVDGRSPELPAPDWSCRPVERDGCVSIIQQIGTTVPKAEQN